MTTIEGYMRDEEREADARFLASQRESKRAFRKALRNYHRHVVPMAGDPIRRVLKVCGVLIVAGILLVIAWGVL